MAEFRLLGPVGIGSGGRPVPVGQPRQRAVLAALLVDAGRPVTPEALVERVWGRDAPDGARHSLHEYVTRIRRLLLQLHDPEESEPRLLRQGGAYLLDVPPDQVDLHRFRSLVDRARRSDRSDQDRAALLRSALVLWQGEPLADVPGEWADQVRERTHRLRVDAATLWADALLRTGHADDAVEPLTELATAYPTVEPLTAALIRVLAADGRVPEAVARYDAVRDRLLEELGSEPGPELTAARDEVLSGRSTPAGAPAPVTEHRMVPAQLPLGVRGFAGRTEEISRLDAVLTEPHTTVDNPRIIVLTGTAGVGKTALAVHWTHRVAARFPDGQVYVNLRGFDPAGPAMHPADAVRAFLDALEVTPDRIPADLDAQAALYRRLVAGRRMLVLLDNARDAAQVRPLLPGSASCLVLVTSRDQLASLVVTEGAHPIPLDLLATAEARELLSRRLGPARVAAEPGPVNVIIERCARLPLALSIVAARAVTNPRFPLATLADDLSRARGPLDTLAGGDAAADLRAVFSWSYRSLGPAAAQLFRLLGRHPGPDLGVAEAASLAGTDPAEVRPALTELARASLVAEQSPGRYGSHDLLRAYSAELARSPDLDAATARLLDHYLHTAHAAARVLDADRDPIAVGEPAPGVRTEPIADHAAALAWFGSRHANLLAAIDLAVGAGYDRHAWQLPWTLITYFERRGHWHDWAATHKIALAAAERVGDPAAQAYARRALGIAYARLGRYDEALMHYRAAVERFDAAGDRTGLAHAQLNLAWVLTRQDRRKEALAAAEEALDLYRAVGHRAGQARALNNAAMYLAELGEHRRTLELCRQALDLYRATGNRYGEAAVSDTLGYAHHHLGDYADAVASFERALALCREVGDRRGEATVLDHLGDTRSAAGEPALAHDAWRAAAAILADLGHADEARVRAKLPANTG